MIRRAEYKDIASLLELYKQLSTFDVSILEADIAFKAHVLASDKTHIFVNEQFGKVVAMVTLHLLPRLGKTVARIEDLVVDKEFRDQGLGRELVGWCITMSKIAGCYKILLDCSDHNVALYKRLGFTEHETSMRYNL